MAVLSLGIEIEAESEDYIMLKYDKIVNIHLLEKTEREERSNIKTTQIQTMNMLKNLDHEGEMVIMIMRVSALLLWDWKQMLPTVRDFHLRRETFKR